MNIRLCVSVFALVLLTATGSGADEQQIAPGTGLQDAIVIDTGADGLCNTTAATGDIQLAAIGSGSPNRPEIKCGTNKVVDTVAAGDDVQLIAAGGTCKNTTTTVIDTGANGIADTVALVDDTQTIPFGTAAANQACVITGADGVAQTTPAAGDDVQLLLAGAAEINTSVALCGPNLIADTTANNVAAGDDVQRVAPGAACTANEVVVDSGADGIATTQAEGPDLRLAVVKAVKIKIGAGKPSASKRVLLKITNTEFGTSAPASRGFRIATTNGSCPAGVVSQVDADFLTPGLQATGTVLLGMTAKASLVATAKLQNVTTVGSRNPYRCAFNVSIVALDTDPDVDDGANQEGNSVDVVLEVTDLNDR